MSHGTELESVGDTSQNFNAQKDLRDWPNVRVGAEVQRSLGTHPGTQHGVGKKPLLWENGLPHQHLCRSPVTTRFPSSVPASSVLVLPARAEISLKCPELLAPSTRSRAFSNPTGRGVVRSGKGAGRVKEVSREFQMHIIPEIWGGLDQGPSPPPSHLPKLWDLAHGNMAKMFMTQLAKAGE